MIRLLSSEERSAIESIYESEWDADAPAENDAVIGDMDGGEIVAFITSEAMVRLGMLWLTPRLRNTLAGAKRIVNLFKWLKRSAPQGSHIIVFADEPQFESIAERMGMRPVEGKIYRIDL